MRGTPMSLRWKYVVVVLSAIVATAAGTMLFHRIAYPLDPELAAVGSALAMAVVVSATLLAAYRSFVARPLARIAEGARRMAAGDRRHRIDVEGDDEMARIARVLDELAEEIARAQGDLEAQVAERTEDLRAVLEEVHARSRIAEEVNRRLAEVDRRRMEFLTKVSHDLRTPLNSILGYLELLQDRLYESDEERAEFLGNARLSARHLLHLVTSVLDATQLEEGHLSFDLHPVHPGDVIHEVLRIMEVHAREKEIEIRMEADGTALVFADEAKLRQVLINLVSNAIKFTEAGEIRVRTRAAGGRVRIEVKDTGIGIPHDELERIFQKFHQVPTEDGSHGGTGLGLAISKQLVELMGGTIHAESEGSGRGARFVIELPAPDFAPEADVAADPAGVE